MVKLLFMIDGLGKPPKDTWYDLANQVGSLLGSQIVYHDYGSFEKEIKRINFTTTSVVAIGHSLGALEILQATDKYPMLAAIGIDPVHYRWSDAPIKTGTLTQNIICYRRRRILSPPPSVGVWSKHGHENVEVPSGWFGHNKIIADATPMIVQYVKTRLL